jgi:hypothetical protein
MWQNFALVSEQLQRQSVRAEISTVVVSKKQEKGTNEFRNRFVLLAERDMIAELHIVY